MVPGCFSPVMIKGRTCRRLTVAAGAAILPLVATQAEAQRAGELARDAERGLALRGLALREQHVGQVQVHRAAVAKQVRALRVVQSVRSPFSGEQPYVSPDGGVAVRKIKVSEEAAIQGSSDGLQLIDAVVGACTKLPQGLHHRDLPGHRHHHLGQ